jgi:hypothetical protein
MASNAGPTATLAFSKPKSRLDRQPRSPHARPHCTRPSSCYLFKHVECHSRQSGALTGYGVGLTNLLFGSFMVADFALRTNTAELSSHPTQGTLGDQTHDPNTAAYPTQGLVPSQHRASYSELVLMCRREHRVNAKSPPASTRNSIVSMSMVQYTESA